MDSLLLRHGLINGRDAVLAVVCDGVGSLSDGALASGMAVRGLNSWFAGVTTSERLGIRMRDEIIQVNTQIITEAKNKNLETASTLSALLLFEDTYYIAHIGDSRIYGYERGELSALTCDDISASGKLTAFLGKSADIVIQYIEGTVAGKTFLLCSDGLYKRMDADMLNAQLMSAGKQSLKETVEALVGYVIRRGEQDNITLALIKTI
jgi:serine/threonine protein phosphatase PrpC